VRQRRPLKSELTNQIATPNSIIATQNKRLRLRGIGIPDGFHEQILVGNPEAGTQTLGELRKRTR